MNDPEQIQGPSEEEIAECAYLIWEHEGRPEGRAEIHWSHAADQLIACYAHEKWVAAHQHR